MKHLKRLISALLLTAVLATAVFASAATIKDVPAKNWAYPYVSKMVDMDIMQTHDGGYFYPDLQIIVELADLGVELMVLPVGRGHTQVVHRPVQEGKGLLPRQVAVGVKAGGAHAIGDARTDGPVHGPGPGIIPGHIRKARVHPNGRGIHSPPEIEDELPPAGGQPRSAPV